jgi:hypothetical protein
MKKITAFLIIGLFISTGCKTQALKPFDSLIVFYVVAKNNTGIVNKIMERCFEKKIDVEEIVLVDPKILQPNLSSIIVFKFSVNLDADDDLEKIKNKFGSVEGIINIWTGKNKSIL